MFVNGAPVPITEGQNTLYIRPKMDLGTRSACMDALAAIGGGGGDQVRAELRLGAYQVALMQHNILSWSGPAFQGVPCTPEQIAKLDPDEPLVARAIEEIARRNPLPGAREAAAEKKDGASAGPPPLPGDGSGAGSGTTT